MQSYAIILSMMLGLFIPISSVTAIGSVEGQDSNLAKSPAAAQTDINPIIEKQRAALNKARNLMERPLNNAPAAGTTGQPNTEKAKSSSGIIGKIFLLIGLIIFALTAAFFFYKNQQPVVTDVAADDAPTDARNVRAVLDKNGGTSTGAADVKNTNASNPRFLELAVENQLITTSERASLEERFQGNDYAIMLFLVEQRPKIKNTLGKLWGDSLGVAYTDPTKTIIQYELVNKLPKIITEQQNVIPLYAVDNVITVAMTDPMDETLQRQIEGHMDALVNAIFALPDQIKAALEIAQISLRTLTDQLPEKLASAAQEGAKIGRLAEDKSIAEFVRGLFLLALKQRASDIHIEPHDNGVFIRLRIDGALQEYLNLPMRLFPSLSNVIKIMAGADIGERRRPQDGRITLKLPDRELEFRFSCVPTIYGEKIVLRLLGQNQFASVPGLEDLNFSKSILQGIRQIIDTPNGVAFITGPTGSGKTTTLYAALKELNRKDLNVMTIEDPVEYRLPGINQVQVNPQAGVTFATALRSFLRQDPDVILVGEIRDLETATIASQAALTGHLVLTTLHTNNALQAVTRLIQIGVEPFLVAPSIIGVMAQRLVRRLCENCKEKYALTPGEIEKHFTWDGKREVFFYRKKGCEQCNYTGYSGRLAIHELFIIDDEMRNYIARNASILDIQKYAHSAGFTTMRYDGFKKVLMGLTTVEEVSQVTVAGSNFSSQGER